MPGELDRLDVAVARLDRALARAIALPGDPIAAWELSFCILMLSDHQSQSCFGPALCSLIDQALHLARQVDLGADPRPLRWWTRRSTDAQIDAADRARSKLLDIAAALSVMRRW